MALSLVGDLERIRAALLAGDKSSDVASRLHYSTDYVRNIRRRLQRAGLLPQRRGAEVYAPWEPADLNAEARREALERGRALAAAKVAAGEWVLPKEGVA